MRDPLPPPLPTQKKRGCRRVLFWVVVVPLLAIAGVFALGGLFLLTGKSLPVRDADRAILVKADDLAECADWFEPIPGREEISRTRYLDGSYEVEYEYEQTEEDEDYFYCYCLVTVDTSESDAEITYAIGAKGTELIWEADDLEFVDRSDLFPWPSPSRCALLVRPDGSYLGNYFTCRSGKRTFEWLVSGMYFEEKEALDSLLRPVLERLRDYDPE